MKVKNPFLLAFFLLFTSILFAQTPIEVGSAIKVKMADGNIYQGTLTEHNEDNIVVETEQLGSLSLTKSQISRVIPLYQGDKNKKSYLYDNPNATRNIYAPTGYGLRKGEGYYHNFMMMYNSVSYGITNNITIGVGVIPIVVDDFVPFSVTPKVSIPVIKDRLNFGVGTIYMRLGSEQVGIAYGVGTYGSRDRNISVGTGWGYVENEWSDRPVVTVSGQYRISKRWGLVTENWFIPTYRYSYEEGRTKKYLGLVSYSARFIGEWLSIDFGFINQADVFQIFPLGIPIVGVVVPFGKPYRHRKIKW